MQVVRVVQDHSDELEADLREFFQVDLLDLYRGQLSIRQLHVFISSLLRKQGRSSLLMAIEPGAEWSVEAWLSARISDAEELSNYLYQMANTPEDKQDDIPIPTPIPRPGDPEPETASELDFSTGEELSNFFTQMSGM